MWYREEGSWWLPGQRGASWACLSGAVASSVVGRAQPQCYSFSSGLCEPQIRPFLCKEAVWVMLLGFSSLDQDLGLVWESSRRAEKGVFLQLDV